jgi:AcrR family transcriptional regulator
MNQKEFTLQRLKDAFERLRTGHPERTKADGNISIKRVNEEAGLSRGAIYHYKSYVQELRVEIAAYEAERKKSLAIDGLQHNLTVEAKLRSERDREKRLKIEYRDQLANFKQLTDKVIAENVSLAFRCKELQDELARATALKVTDIRKK